VADCMMHCNLSRYRLNVKHSSFKQMTKFLKAMSKRGWLVTKTQGRDGELVVSGVNRSSRAYVDQPLTKDALKAIHKSKNRVAKPKSESESKSKAPGASSVLQVLFLYRPKNILSEVFGKENMSNLYDMGEARKILWEYVAKHDLGKGANVVLNAGLANGIKGMKEGQSVSKADLSKAFGDSFDLYHAIVTDGDVDNARFKKGPAPKVAVHIEKRGSKSVTIVQGLEVYGIDPVAFARASQKKHACSCTTHEVQNKSSAKFMEVVIQGNKADAVRFHLQSDYHIPIAQFK